MNKKLIALVAVIVIAVTAVCIVSFTGTNEPETTAPAEGQPITVNLEPETTKEPFFKPSYDTKITVTLPIEVVDKKYGGDLEAFAEAKGYFSIEKKGDSHVKIKMREYSYRLLLTTVGMETVSGIGYALDSGNYPFIVKLAKYDENFSDIVFIVDKEKYSKAENKDAADFRRRFGSYRKILDEIGIAYAPEEDWNPSVTDRITKTVYFLTGLLKRKS